jgi:DNA-binding transcriptional regulator/RsmH inhibitor MraZ
MKSVIPNAMIDLPDLNVFVGCCSQTGEPNEGGLFLIELDEQSSKRRIEEGNVHALVKMNEDYVLVGFENRFSIYDSKNPKKAFKQGEEKEAGFCTSGCVLKPPYLKGRSNTFVLAFQRLLLIIDDEKGRRIHHFTLGSAFILENPCLRALNDRGLEKFVWIMNRDFGSDKIFLATVTDGKKPLEICETESLKARVNCLETCIIDKEPHIFYGGKGCYGLITYSNKARKLYFEDPLKIDNSLGSGCACIFIMKLSPSICVVFLKGVNETIFVCTVYDDDKMKFTRMTVIPSEFRTVKYAEKQFVVIENSGDKELLFAKAESGNFEVRRLKLPQIRV